jgi:D-psicose/D-tagatose/L-ribulose 3-epimerase
MVRNDVGLSTFVLASPFTDRDAASFDRVADMGYDLIEVCIEDPTVLSANWIAEQASRTGLAVSICGAFGPGRDISSADAETRDGALHYLKTCVDIAAVVGSSHVAGPMYAVTGSPPMRDEVERVAKRARAAEGLGLVADYAAGRGIRLAIEPLNRFETDLVNTVEQGVELCGLIGRTNVGLLIDTFHMNIEEKNIGDAVRAAGDLVFHVQVSENDRGAPGSGHVPWEQFFASLHDIGYSGPLVVESFLPTVQEIARAVSLWRPVAASMDELAVDGLAFVRGSFHQGRGPAK